MQRRFVKMNDIKLSYIQSQKRKCKQKEAERCNQRMIMICHVFEKLHDESSVFNELYIKKTLFSIEKKKDSCESFSWCLMRDSNPRLNTLAGCQTYLSEAKCVNLIRSLTTDYPARQAVRW